MFQFILYIKRSVIGAVVILNLTTGNTLVSQEMKSNVSHETKTFLGYLNQTRVSKRFGIWFDIHYRTTENFVSRPFQTIGRIGVIYYLTDFLKITVGHCYAYNFPASGSSLLRTEQRPWEQISWRKNLDRIQIQQVFRVEQRFFQAKNLDNGSVFTDYINRLRYSFKFLLSLNKNTQRKNKIYLAFNEEILIHCGKAQQNNWDQNRFFAGFEYQLSKNNILQLGYMNIFQKIGNTSRYTSNDCIRIYYYHNIDFRREI